MVERSVMLVNMESQEGGKVQLRLHDNELDHDFYVWLQGNEVAQLGAFPGSKVKFTIEKL